MPVAPAAARVWQLAHSLWKIVLPSFPSSDGGFASAAATPATDATYAATSWAFWPVTRLSGIGFDASRIWSSTTFWIVLSLNPCWRDGPNDASRFGPIVPLVPAAGERVAAAAARGEELLPVLRVRRRRGLSARAAARRDENGRDGERQSESDPAHGGSLTRRDDCDDG